MNEFEALTNAIEAAAAAADDDAALHEAVDVVLDRLVQRFGSPDGVEAYVQRRTVKDPQIFGPVLAGLHERIGDPDARFAVVDSTLIYFDSSYAVAGTARGARDERLDQHWIFAENTDTAAESARERWIDMAENDTEEFCAIVGVETLIGWALGRSSLDAWLAGVDPSQEFGTECDVEYASPGLVDDLAFAPTVAYRN